MSEDFNKYAKIWKQENDPNSLIVQLSETNVVISLSYDSFHRSPWASSYDVEDEHAKTMIVSNLDSVSASPNRER